MILDLVVHTDVPLQGDQRIVLHKQNAVAANVGDILDATKKKKAGKLKRVVRGSATVTR